MGKNYDYVIHEHQAKRAGLHYDLRIMRDDQMLESFAMRKSPFEMKKGDKHLIIRQPLHDITWLSFEGEIKSGYGAGTLKIVDKGIATLIRVDENKHKVWVFDFKGKKLNDRYAIVYFKDNYFLFVRMKYNY